MRSTGRLALLISFLASTCCSSGVRRAQDQGSVQDQESETTTEQAKQSEKAVKPVAQPRSPRAAKPPAVPTITDEDLTKAKQDYQSGVEAFEWGRYADAAQYLEQVYEVVPSLSDVQEYLERTYIALGMERYTAGQPEEAIVIWKKVLRIDPSDEKAKTYIARTKEEIARLPADKSD